VSGQADSSFAGFARVSTSRGNPQEEGGGCSYLAKIIDELFVKLG
jgi:hypothetical protein